LAGASCTCAEPAGREGERDKEAMEFEDKGGEDNVVADREEDSDDREGEGAGESTVVDEGGDNAWALVAGAAACGTTADVADIMCRFTNALM
jgi:hypothetical protein